MMATEATPKPRRADPNRELMRKMGGNGSYTAMPPDQHLWQIAPNEPPLYRAWSWMIYHTCFFGHQSPYAVDGQGTELHLAHLAKDLGMDEGNARRTWREGVRRGLWRNGTFEEGERRLYLCARVPKAPAATPEDPGEVCTDLLPPTLQSLPPYMQEQLRELPKEKVRDIATWYARHTAAANLVKADLLAAGRMVVDQLEDTGWKAFGLEPRLRQGEKPGRDATAEEIAARQARLEALSPVIRRSVQTALETVQTEVAGLNNDLYTAPTDRPTLLPLTTANRGGRADLTRTEHQRASTDPIQSNEGSAPMQLHRPPMPDPSREEAAAVDVVIENVATWQRTFPKRWEKAERMVRTDKGDRTTALRIVRAVGVADVPNALLWLEERVGSNALGKRVGVGLLVQWAETGWAEAKAEREKERVAAVERARVVEAEREAREREIAFDEAVAAELERRWEALPEEERDRLKDQERRKLKDTREWLTLSAVLRDGRVNMAAMWAFKRAEREAVVAELAGKQAKHA